MAGTEHFFPFHCSAMWARAIRLFPPRTTLTLRLSFVYSIHRKNVEGYKKIHNGNGSIGQGQMFMVHKSKQEETRETEPRKKNERNSMKTKENYFQVIGNSHKITLIPLRRAKYLTFQKI